jgi:hypothetical protein
MAKLNTLDSSVERKVRGDKKKEVSWPTSVIVTRDNIEELNLKYDKKFEIGQEICDPVPLYLRQGEKRKPTIIDELKNELRKEQIKQQVIEDHYEFDKMNAEDQRAFFESESDFELPDDHPSILTAYEQAGLVYDAKPEYPTNEETPVNTTENPPPAPPAEPSEANGGEATA